MRQVPADKDGSPGAGSPGALEILQIAVERLSFDPGRAPRQHRKEQIDALVRSIRVYGLLQPLIVRPAEGSSGERQTYWIVAGEGRYRAALVLGLATVPCYVQTNDQRTRAVRALIGKIHQHDLSDIDKAEALKQLKSLTGLSWDRVADMVDLSSTYVRRLGGLLKLERTVRELVRRGEIPARTAIALKPLPPRMQVELAEQVVRDRLTAEEVRKRARNASAGSTRTTEDHLALPDVSPPSSVTGLLSEAPSLLAGARMAWIIELLEQIDQWLAARDWAPSGLSEEERLEARRYLAAVEKLSQHSKASLQAIQDLAVADPLVLQAEDPQDEQ